MKTKKIIQNLLISAVVFFALDFSLGEIATYGIKKFYGLNLHSEILLIGHSHLMLATNKEQMEQELGMKISKFCREGADVKDRYIMSKMFLESPYSDKLRYVMYGVDLCTFTGEGLSSNSYMAFYPFMYSESMESYIKGQASPKDFYLKKFLHLYRFNDDVTKNAAIRGLRSDWSNKKHNVIDIETYKQRLANHDERSIQMNPELISMFKETIKMFTNRGIKVILVHTPTLDLLNDYEPDKFADICKWYEDYAAGDKMIEYWDFNPDYCHRHELFNDRLHVNATGQKLISSSIVEKFKSYEN